MNVKERKATESQLIDEYLAKCKQRVKDLKKDFSTDYEIINNKSKEKKSRTQTKKTYKAILKVACFFAVFVLFSFIYNLIFPINVMDAILVLLKDIFPSFDDSTGMEHFVN